MNRPLKLRLPWGLLAYVLVACGPCGGRSASVVAELVASRGEVKRAHPQIWENASKGSVFELGDGLRTAAAASAELTLAPEGHLRVEANTTVRFERTPPGAGGAQRLRLETGVLEMEAQTDAIDLITAGGTTHVARGTRLRVASESKRIHFAVAVGRIAIERDGQQHSVVAGESFTLDVGAPIVEPLPPQQASRQAAVDDPQSAPRPMVTADAAEHQVHFEQALQTFALALVAGESATVHDPRPPTDVRVSQAGCSQDVGIEFVRSGPEHATTWARGAGAVIARLHAGTYRYRAHCLRAASVPNAVTVAEGSLRIMKDSGTRRLPNEAPSVRVAVDGRHYAIHFQNLPPKLVVEWPKAPPVSGYTLEVRGDAGLKISQRSAQPSVSLASGKVEEGSYRFWMEAGAARSPEGTLRVLFDESARTASVSEPVDGVFASGTSVHVVGAALHGARVEVGGRALILKGQGRFAADTTVSAGSSAIAVRVQHPATGVHYFLRHTADARR